MRKINYKLIVSDFDGTLLTSEHQVPDELRSAIGEYVSCGGIFAVCTGRMLRSILPRVRELGLKGLVVAYQGTVIAEIESGKIIKKNALSVSETAEICRCVESLKHCINTYSDEVFYTTFKRDNEYLKRYETITGVEAVCIEIPMSEYVLKNNLNCQKVTVLVSPADRENLYNSLRKKLQNKYDVTCSADVLVEISPKGDNKGKALEFIANHYDIPQSSTIAIGDNLNDLPMIRAAEIGVAVGNAVEALKREADYVTVTNDELAVAKIIEKYGFI